MRQQISCLTRRSQPWPNSPEGPIGDDVPRKEPVVHQSLRACKGLSSRYNREESLENIQRRYDRMLPIARFTIPRLAADPVVSRDLLSLKDDGWRDWQLMMAITTIVGNARPAWEGISSGLRYSTRRTTSCKRTYSAGRVAVGSSNCHETHSRERSSRACWSSRLSSFFLRTDCNRMHELQTAPRSSRFSATDTVLEKTMCRIPDLFRQE